MKPIKQYRLLIERMSHTTDFDTLVMIDALTDAIDEVERLNEKYRTNEIRWMNIVTNIKAENERLSGDNERLKETIHGFAKSAVGQVEVIAGLRDEISHLEDDSELIHKPIPPRPTGYKLVWTARDGPVVDGTIREME